MEITPQTELAQPVEGIALTSEQQKDLLWHVGDFIDVKACELVRGHEQTRAVDRRAPLKEVYRKMKTKFRMPTNDPLWATHQNWSFTCRDDGKTYGFAYQSDLKFDDTGSEVLLVRYVRHDRKEHWIVGVIGLRSGKIVLEPRFDYWRRFSWKGSMAIYSGIYVFLLALATWAMTVVMAIILGIPMTILAAVTHFDPPFSRSKVGGLLPLALFVGLAYYYVQRLWRFYHPWLLTRGITRERQSMISDLLIEIKRNAPKYAHAFHNSPRSEDGLL